MAEKHGDWNAYTVAGMRGGHISTEGFNSEIDNNINKGEFLANSGDFS